VQPAEGPVEITRQKVSWPIGSTVQLIVLGRAIWTVGHVVAELVKELRYKPEASGSIPDGVIGIFHRHNTSGRTMALGLTQPLTEMSTRNIS